MSAEPKQPETAAAADRSFVAAGVPGQTGSVPAVEPLARPVRSVTPGGLECSPATDASHRDLPARSSKHVLFEPLALVLLSLATVGTAWCSFQAASWQGVSQRFMNLSAAAGRRAAGNELKSTQFGLLDVMLFSEYINARAGGNEATARFYADRFRGEAKDAFQAWMASNPFSNTNAPPHPFVASLYKPLLLTQAEEAEAESQRYWQQSGDAGRAARGYVLVTVVLACALFCAGTASKFDTAWVRRAVLIAGLCAFAFAATRLLLLPVQI